MFGDWEYRIVETPDEENKITSQSVSTIENVLMSSAVFEPEPISSETKQILEMHIFVIRYCILEIHIFDINACKTRLFC